MNMVPIINFLVTLTFFGFWVVSFFILYHLTRFGVGLLPKRLAALFLTGAVVLFCTSLIFYTHVDLTTML